MTSIPNKTMKKQHSGVASVIGCVGFAIMVAGVVLAVVGAARGEDTEWDEMTTRVETLRTTSCEYEHSCTRTCLASSGLTDSCISIRSCSTGVGVQTVYTMASNDTDCPLYMYTNGTLRESVCEAASKYAVGDEVLGFAERSCSDDMRRFVTPLGFTLGHPHNVHTDPTYLIHVGAIVIGSGALAALISLGTYFYSKPSFEAARMEAAAARAAPSPKSD